MYSKNKGITDRDYALTPPPGYDGSRFRRRSDGRDDAFPLYGDMPKRNEYRPRKNCSVRERKISEENCIEEFPATKDQFCPEEDSPCICDSEICEECFEDCNEPEDSDSKPEECTPEHSVSERKPERDFSISSFLQNLGSEELLLIALIVLLAKDSNAGMDTVLLLALLLCIS